MGRSSPSGRRPWPTPPSSSRPCRWRRPAATPRSPCPWSPTASPSPAGRVVHAAARGAGGQLPPASRTRPPRCRTRSRSASRPQVHGAFRDTTAFAAEALGTELNAQADNPLVSPVDGTLVSNGNFHPVLLAVAFDALRVAIAHVGQLSGPPARPPVVGVLRGDGRRARRCSTARRPTCPGMHLRYAGRRRLRANCGSWRPRSASTSASSTRAWRTTPRRPRSSVHNTDEALDLLADILTIELLLAADVLDLRPALPPLGHGTGALYASARGATAGLSERSTGRRPPRRARRPPGIRLAQSPDVEPGDGGQHEQPAGQRGRARAARRGTPSPAPSRSAAPAASRSRRPPPAPSAAR